MGILRGRGRDGLGGVHGGKRQKKMAAVDLACCQLSSSIDTAVKKMTHEVLRMQQDECKRSLQHEIETEERKELGNIMANFIQAINKTSAGRRTSES